MTTTSLTATGTGPALRLLSLGAGVQSTTVLLLVCEGEIPRFDVALLADTGWEPREVYTNRQRLTAHAQKYGIPVRQVSAGNIRADALDFRHRFVSMPLHTLNPDGSRGLARRQCTAEYKITPLPGTPPSWPRAAGRRPADDVGGRTGARHGMRGPQTATVRRRRGWLDPCRLHERGCPHADRNRTPRPHDRS